MNHCILTLAINSEHDVVDVRRRARHIAQLLGFGTQDQAGIAAVVCEIARNAFAYASGGRAEFAVDTQAQPPSLCIRILDSGKGIPDLPAVLEGAVPAATGAGANTGILGARRLMDRCDIETAAGKGTTVTLLKRLPAGVPVAPETLVSVASQLAATPDTDATVEVQMQNRELVHTLDELRIRQEELLALTRELEDTKRGMVALCAEIEEKAEHLRRADEMKSKFLSNTSHELRTPLGSIRALAQLLLDRIDGDLTSEQEKQVMLIKRAAMELSDLVNDLLDMAKIEAGKIDVHVSEVRVNALFSMLRAMLRPLGRNNAVELVFEDAGDDITFFTDEGKVAQILRNLISNALKFTKSGEVRVSATGNAASDRIHFSVKDTGIGIASEDIHRIFEESSHVENPMQKHVKGTGLGLPLCRKLATMLGGTIEVESTPGIGSAFLVDLPMLHGMPSESALPDGAISSLEERQLPLQPDSGHTGEATRLASPSFPGQPIP